LDIRQYIGNNLFSILVLFSLVNLFGTWGYFSPQKEAEAYAHINGIDLANICEFFYDCSCRPSCLKGCIFLAVSQIERHW
jgi:hypothetical protein